MDQAEEIVRRAALAEGVDPDVLVSIWQQESGKSSDLGLRGPTLMEGKWAGHYARGPFQIMSFHGDIPSDFAGQARWAARHLKERGVEGYYGKGTVPGMPHMPSSSEYVQQVMGRVPGTFPVGGTPAEFAATLQPTSANMQPPYATPPFNPQGGDPYGSMSGPTFEPRRPGFGTLLMAIADLNRPANSRTGALRMLIEGQDPLKQEEANYKRARNALWSRQLDQEQMRLLGLERMSPAQRAQAEYQRAQVGTKQRELDLRESGLYNQSTSAPPTPELYALMSPDNKVTDYIEVTPGQVPQVPEGYYLLPASTKPPQASGGGVAGAQNEQYLSLIEGTQDLVQTLKENPDSDAKRTLGTLGLLGSKLVGLLDITDSIGLTTNRKQQVIDKVFGGENPVLVRGVLKTAVLPMARLMVDKGVLSGPEQKRALSLLALAGDDGALLGPEDSAELILLVTDAARRAAGQSSLMRGKPEATPPPSMSAPLPTPGQTVIEKNGERFILNPLD
jgi:hypothetical protein